jgi:hypothetical protein
MFTSLPKSTPYPFFFVYVKKKDKTKHGGYLAISLTEIKRKESGKHILMIKIKTPFLKYLSTQHL